MGINPESNSTASIKDGEDLALARSCNDWAVPKIDSNSSTYKFNLSSTTDLTIVPTTLLLIWALNAIFSRPPREGRPFFSMPVFESTKVMPVASGLLSESSKKLPEIFFDVRELSVLAESI